MCNVSMESKALPGHTHTCLGGCEGRDHMCADRHCRRYFQLKGN